MYLYVLYKSNCTGRGRPAVRAARVALRRAKFLLRTWPLFLVQILQMRCKFDREPPRWPVNMSTFDMFVNI